MKTILSCTVFFLLISQSLIAQPSSMSVESDLTKKGLKAPDANNSLFSHFQNSDLLELTLETNITHLIERKKTNNYQSAKLSWTDKDGLSKTMPIKVRPRGKTRRKVCDFPPLKLKFKKSMLVEEGFLPYKSLKLVGHCAEDEMAEQNLLKEYLAYKIYNEITDRSFRVQLLKVNYIDSEDGSDYGQKYAFLIESTKELEARLETEEIKKFSISIKDVERQLAQELALFQYLIGNTDWQIPFMHNVKIFQGKNESAPVVVPYDFDCSGFVNTDYARLNPDFKQEDARQRIYMGANDDYLAETVALYQAKEAAILSLIEDFELLDKKVKKDLLKYVRSFYQVINKEKEIKKSFQPINHQFY